MVSFCHVVMVISIFMSIVVMSKLEEIKNPFGIINLCMACQITQRKHFQFELMGPQVCVDIHKPLVQCETQR